MPTYCALEDIFLVLFAYLENMLHNMRMPQTANTVLAALAALADAGASDHLLGEAVRELIGSQATRTASAPPPPPPVADPSLAFDASPPINAGPPAPVHRPPVARPPVSKQPAHAQGETVVFRDDTGARSSVSIGGAEWQSLLLAHADDPSAARAAIRAAAACAPPGENRSRWAVAHVLKNVLQD